MAKEDNLMPIEEVNSRRTPEQHSEDSRKGGIASGEARREKKLFKEAIERKLGASLDDIIDSMINESMKGNVQATTFLRDTIGEKPTDKLEADVDSNIQINVEIEE